MSMPLKERKSHIRGSDSQKSREITNIFKHISIRPPTGPTGYARLTQRLFTAHLVRRISGEFKHSWGTAEKLYKSEVRSQDQGTSAVLFGEPGA